MARLKMTHYALRIKVQGTGRFPIDMLRYDRCVPASENDAHKIQRACLDEGRSQDVQEIELLKFSSGSTLDELAQLSNASRARWSSFGWTVQPVMVP